MVEKLAKLTHKIAIQLQEVAENCTICSSRSRWPVLKLFDTPSYIFLLLSFCCFRPAFRFFFIYIFVTFLFYFASLRITWQAMFHWSIKVPCQTLHFI